MRFPRSRYLGLFLTGCTLALLGWGMQTYVDLVRLETSVVSTRAQVEAASRVRLELVENLLRDLQSGGRAGALEQLELAATRVRELGPLRADLDEGGGQNEFRDAQSRLTGALEAVWKGRSGSRDRTVQMAISDLKPEIQHWSDALDRGLDELELRLESFRATASGFPGALIAAIPRREGPAGPPVESAASQAGLDTAASGAAQ